MQPNTKHTLTSHEKHIYGYKSAPCIGKLKTKVKIKPDTQADVIETFNNTPRYSVVIPLTTNGLIMYPFIYITKKDYIFIKQ